MRVNIEGLIALRDNGAIRGVEADQLSDSGIAICMGVEILIESPLHSVVPPPARALSVEGWEEYYTTINVATGARIAANTYVIVECPLYLALPQGHSALFYPDTSLALYGLQYAGSGIFGAGVFFERVRIPIFNASRVRSTDILPGSKLGTIVINQDF